MLCRSLNARGWPKDDDLNESNGVTPGRVDLLPGRILLGRTLPRLRAHDYVRKHTQLALALTRSLRSASLRNSDYTAARRSSATIRLRLHFRTLRGSVVLRRHYAERPLLLSHRPCQHS